MATASKMSVTNAQRNNAEGGVLFRGDGGMASSERLEDKKMDEAGQETGKGNGRR